MSEANEGNGNESRWDALSRPSHGRGGERRGGNHRNLGQPHNYGRYRESGGYDGNYGGYDGNYRGYDGNYESRRDYGDHGSNYRGYGNQRDRRDYGGRGDERSYEREYGANDRGYGRGRGFSQEDEYYSRAPQHQQQRNQRRYQPRDRQDLSDPEEYNRDAQTAVPQPSEQQMPPAHPKNIEPVNTFDDLTVNRIIMDNLRRCGYKDPTPVQRFGIPVALNGCDMMACAQTGSGKTAAFLIPIVDYILSNGVSLPRQRTAFPIALIMAPTRELASQTFDEARKLCYLTDIVSVVVYGGTEYSGQYENLEQGCDILVATPGRLNDMFTRGKIAFECVKFLILDEADRMLDLGFEPQIEEIICGKYSDMPSVECRQTMMYSATFPRIIQNLARRYLKRASYLLTVGRVGSTTKNIHQRIAYAEDAEKKDVLLRILFAQAQKDLVLVFTQTKRDADDLHTLLLGKSIPSNSIHGDRKQWEREAALEDFKSGICPILVATDVASRGLDIPNVAHVVQYDLPNSMEDYVHRIGRTGRAGNEGWSTAFYNAKNENLRYELMRFLQDHEQPVPDWMEAAQMESAAIRGSQPGRGRRGGRPSDRRERFDNYRPPRPQQQQQSQHAHRDDEPPDDWEDLAGGESRRGPRGWRGRGGRYSGGDRGREPNASPPAAKPVFHCDDGGF